jgi:hypothetical protein
MLGEALASPNKTLAAFSRRVELKLQLGGGAGFL